MSDTHATNPEPSVGLQPQVMPEPHEFEAALRVLRYLKHEVRRNGYEYGAAEKRDMYADFLREKWLHLCDIEEFIEDEYAPAEHAAA